ncbi:MAG: L,D-transpeptidase family protein [Bacteroidia bacterium]|nr:L,D-transpeptidase family protein [Bacteroidia bacterium]
MKIKILNILSVLIVLVLLSFDVINTDEEFKRFQMSNSRVTNAFNEKIDSIDNILLKNNLSMNNYEIFLRVFKQENTIELWAKNKQTDTFTLINNYKICITSGFLGPKRMQGDKQIPEGVYYINEFNPNSNYHLSLGINYPNKSDSILGKKNKLGGEIYIHGGCQSVGCVPVTTNKIKEIYIFALQARYYGQKKIPVHIFPCKLNNTNFEEISLCYNSTENTKIWSQLKLLYNLFNKNHSIPSTHIDSKGNYSFYYSK